MAGPSMSRFHGCWPPLLPSSHAWSWVRMVCGEVPDATVRPSAVRGWDLMGVGSWQQLPSVFQSSHGWLLPSTTTEGSIEPPAP